MIQVDGMNQVIGKLEAAQNVDAIAEELYQAGDDMLKEAVANAPVGESGDLQGSARIINRGKVKATSIVSFGSAAVDYAAYPHDGTKSQAAQPFLADAFDEVAKGLEKRLTEAAQREVKK